MLLMLLVVVVVVVCVVAVDGDDDAKLDCFEIGKYCFCSSSQLCSDLCDTAKFFAKQFIQ